MEFHKNKMSIVKKKVNHAKAHLVQEAKKVQHTIEKEERDRIRALQ